MHQVEIQSTNILCVRRPAKRFRVSTSSVKPLAHSSLRIARELVKNERSRIEQRCGDVRVVLRDGQACGLFRLHSFVSGVRRQRARHG